MMKNLKTNLLGQFYRVGENLYRINTLYLGANGEPTVVGTLCDKFGHEQARNLPNIIPLQFALLEGSKL